MIFGREQNETARRALIQKIALEERPAFVVGHVHGYERFIRYGRTFIVTGGAGGPRVEYRIGDEAVIPPAYSTPTGGVRAFHYVAIRDAGSSLEFEVKCLTLDAPRPGGIFERFSVVLPMR